MTLLFLFFLNCAHAQAGTKTFTAVASDSAEKIFAGLKDDQKGVGITGSLVEIDLKSLKTRKIALPKEIREREVRVILADKDNVFVLTQWVIEQGDAPLLHVLDRASGKWKKLGTAECPGVARIRVKSDALELECGEEKPESKILTISTGKWKLPASEPITLPQAKAKSGESEASLLGPVFESDRLKIRTKGREKIFNAKGS